MGYRYFVGVDYANGNIGEFPFRSYEEAKAFFDSLEDVPFKDITADSDKGTVYLDRGGYECI